MYIDFTCCIILNFSWHLRTHAKHPTYSNMVNKDKLDSLQREAMSEFRLPLHIVCRSL